MSDLVRQQQEIEGEAGGSLSKILSEIQGEREHGRRSEEIVAPKPLESRLPMRRSMPGQTSFELLDLGPRETRTTSLVLQYYMKPRKIVVAESVPNSTVIESLFFGSANQFPSSGKIMSSFFSGSVLGGGYSMDVIRPGVTASITATNLTDQPVKFTASLFGDMLM